MNDDFNVEKENDTVVAQRKTINIKVIVIVTVLLVIALLVYLYINNKSSAIKKCALEVDVPYIMYIDEPLDIPITIKGPDKYVNQANTSVFSSEEILNVDDEEIIGNSGSVLIDPISTGKEDINIISTIGADKYNRILAKKKISITVCPKFDDNLLTEKSITMQRGSTKSLDIDFGESECSEIVTYDSTDTNVVTVDDNGNITAINSGTANIIVFNGTTNIKVNVIII